jgi:hypothetical protein
MFRKSEAKLCPIFDDELLKQCNISAQDTELFAALKTLRRAMLQYQENSAAMDGQNPDIAALIDAPMESRAGANLAGQNGFRAPPSSKHSLPKGQRLDFETMTVDTWSSDGLAEIGLDKPRMIAKSVMLNDIANVFQETIATGIHAID